MNTSRIRLRHLRTVLEVARQKAVGQAASLLNVSQPAVSRTVRELEAELGVPLFEKDGRGIRLTRAGAVFVRHAGAALAALQQGIDAISGPGRGPSVRIGALPTVSARVMPRAVELFRRARTDSPLQIVTGENTVLLDQLRAGRLDLVIGRLASTEQMEGLAFSYLYSERVVFVVRPDHPLLTARHFDFNAIRNFVVLLPPKGSVIRPVVDRYLLTRGQSPFPDAIETVSDAFGRAFVAESDAVWIISEGVVARERTSGQLIALPLDTADTMGAVGLTLREGAPANTSVDILASAVGDAVRALEL